MLAVHSQHQEVPDEQNCCCIVRWLEFDTEHEWTSPSNLLHNSLIPAVSTCSLLAADLLFPSLLERPSGALV